VEDQFSSRSSHLFNLIGGCIVKGVSSSFVSSRMPDNRLTYRRRHSYNTATNKVKKVRTPGGKLVFHYLAKKPGLPKCGDCKQPLPGVIARRPRQLAGVSKRFKTVTRAYGGSRCHTCVKQRIVRAFLIEEQKIVKRVLKAQTSTKKKE